MTSPAICLTAIDNLAQACGSWLATSSCLHRYLQCSPCSPLRFRTFDTEYRGNNLR